MHQSILSRRRARFNKWRKANLRSFRALGIEQAIMRTSQDERVCEKCRSLHNRAINVRSANQGHASVRIKLYRGLLSVHLCADHPGGS